MYQFVVPDVEERVQVDLAGRYGHNRATATLPGGPADEVIDRGAGSALDLSDVDVVSAAEFAVRVEDVHLGFGGQGVRSAG